jgi:hypothetical protein
MSDYVINGDAVDSVGNRTPFTTNLFVGSGVVFIEGDKSSSFVTTPGLVYEIQGPVNFLGCSLMVKGAELRMAPGAVLTINAQGATYLNGAPLDEAQMDAEPSLVFYQGGRPNIALPLVVHRRLDGVGDDPTWLATDTLVSGPRTHGSKTASPFTKGATVPLDAESGLPVGIFNVTRRGIIQGVAGDESYIVVMPDAGVPILEGVQLRYLGRQSAYPIPPDINNTGQPGKFSTHFHRMKDNSRGGRVKNCVYIDCKNQGLWPHNCHGIEWIDNLVYRTEREGAAWDSPSLPNDGDLADTRSDDLYYEGNHFLQMEHVQSYRAGASGFILSKGSNNVIGPGNAISGVNGRGVVWPEINLANISSFPWVWLASIAVDHCIDGIGDRGGYDMWLNNPVAEEFPVRVHSGQEGIRLGAYSISLIVARIEDIGFCRIGISQHAQSSDIGDGYGLRVLGPGVVHDSIWCAIRMQKHVPPPNVPILYKDLTFTNNPVVIEDRSAENSGIYPSIADFVDCTVNGQPLVSYLTNGQAVPTLIMTAPNAVAGAQYRVQNGASAFQFSESGVATAIAPFYP